MAKQELDEGLDLTNAVSIKKGSMNKLVSLFQFILSILILPLLMGLTISFSQQIAQQEYYIANNFIFGLVAYLILHMFIFQPHSFYKFEQGFVERIFCFFGPIKGLFLHRLPVFSLLTFIVYFILKVFFEYDNILGNFIFLISFTAFMHLVLAASQLKEESSGILKGDYFLSLSTVYLCDILFISVFIKLMVDGFSVTTFLKEGFSFFISTHTAIWQQLFVIK